MAAHASAPFVVTWDDHEVDNDYAGDFDEHGTPPELFLLRRAAAYQAYYETMPLRASALPSGSHMRIYRRLQFGNLIDLTRARHASVAVAIRRAATASTATAPRRSTPARTILGAEQETVAVRQSGRRDGAVDRASASRCRPTRATAQASSPDGRFSMDKWDGYVASRQRLYTRLQETKAPNPIVLSGDVHIHFGADLKTRLRESTLGDRRRRVHELVDYDRRDGSDVGPGWDETKDDNPHIKYPQRAPRLHRVHRHAGDDARRLQDPRSRHRAGSAGAQRRLAGRPGRTPGQLYGLVAGCSLLVASFKLSGASFDPLTSSGCPELVERQGRLTRA